MTHLGAPHIEILLRHLPIPPPRGNATLAHFAAKWRISWLDDSTYAIIHRAMPERVVIDTSVFVSALKSADGASRAVLRLCFQGDCQPIVGQKLMSEYESVLGRSGLFDQSPLSEEERDELLDAFLSASEWVAVFFLWRPNLPDEGDNHLIELAVAGAATKLITHNRRDFQRGELKFALPEIMTPAEFLNFWRNHHGHDDDSNS